MAEGSTASAAELAQQRFKELNLPEDVLAQYRKRFDALDLNKDGIVELREFAAVSRVFGYNLSRDEIMVSGQWSAFRTMMTNSVTPL